MAQTVQLNLFGDFLDFDKYLTKDPEVKNGIDLLGSDGKRTLGEVSSKQVQAIDGRRDIGGGTGESREPGQRDDSRTNGEGNAQERSIGDSSSTIRTAYTGGESRIGNPSGINDSYEILKLHGNLFSITKNDVEAILDQYAGKFAGFNAETNTTNGFDRLYRESSGTPLWEDMNNDERKKEVLEYIQKDFLTAVDELKGRNPVDYLLDRALDPLDSLREVYRAILKNAGATIENNLIKLPEYLQKELNTKFSDTAHLSISRSPGTLRNGHTDDLGNYHISADDHIGQGGKVAKFEANLAAIKLLKQLSEEKRYAAPEEQSILVKYTGWGGLSEVFKKNLEEHWLDRQNALKAVLSNEEFSSASRSTLNAHYTSPEIISTIWTAVERMGYSGGPTLEPATGIGHFFGKRPQHLPIQMHGIELDSISGRIAQQLYQSADIKISGYEDISIQENKYNLIISNVPFGDYKPYEQKRNQTPGLDNRYFIHDFYFLKSLHGLREGGLIAFVTSTGTLDKSNSEVREKIAEKADFVGAIRLPNNAFKQIADTEVVTDIVFLQKRSPEREMSELTKTFINTGTLSIPSASEPPVNFSINQYYIDHPEMVIGSHDLTGSMYSANEYTVVLPSDDLANRLEFAASKLPENIMEIMVDERTKELDDSIKHAVSHIDIERVPRGSYVVGLDNKLYQKNFESGEIKLSTLYENENQNSNEILRIMQMSSIRDCVKEAIDHYHCGQQQEVTRDLSRLNSLYDSFIKEHGFLNLKKNLKSFNCDPDSSLLQSLEIWDPKQKTATKADIFDGITFIRKESPTSVDSPVDAMVLSLSRYGNLNISYMETLTGYDRDSLINSLISSNHIFQDPYDYLNNNRTTYVTSDDYLSGNIREKIKIAQEAAEKDPILFTRNVTELQKVLPKEIASQDISLRINSPIIGESHIKDFIAELLDQRTGSVDVFHMPITGKWEIKVDKRYTSRSTENWETYGTPDMSAVEIVNTLMNGKPIKVYHKPEKDQPPVIDQDATAAAELKAEAINSAFNKWIWRDQSRTDDIVKRYNEVFNSTVERSYIHPERIVDPSAKVWIHGCNFPYPLRSNQADAVWRVLQNNNTMLAHSVGAGKTLEMACSAMELRRLGLRNKPMIVCPDHMIGQWASEFRQAFPSAKLLIADDNNWGRENRRVFVNKIATTDCDAVLIRGESFKMIPMSQEYQVLFFEKKIAEYKEILKNCDASQRKTRSVKDLEKAVTKYEEKIDELTDSIKDEGVIPFDKLGIDHLFIDEADVFKNLEYYTQLQNVRGLGTPQGSERAIDMLMKVRYVQGIEGGVTFATGTPISNTLVEAYTMQRFLQPEVLKANGLEAFDEWARQYAESVTQMELNNTGTGYTPVTRFSKIVNVPELVTSLRQVWDIQTAQNLEKNGVLVPGVNLPRMTIINEAAPSTPLLQSYLKHLEQREKSLSGKAEKGSDNVLCIMTDGGKAAIDMRFINPYFPDDPDSKLNLSVKLIKDVYFKYEKEKYTCAVFFDKSRSFDKQGNIVFDGVADMRRKLMESGISAHEIGDVRDCKTFDQRQKLFERVRDGKCRVIFGTTQSMGAGTNFQQYLKAVIHVDAPWRPRDIEQQNGRGYRPGNKTGELLVYNVVTMGSLDTGRWNVLETKANSIRQVMDGSDKNTREIDENYYGSVKELSIDNPLMKEAIELEQSLKKLRSHERSFNSEIANACRRIQSLPNEIEIAEEYFNKVSNDRQQRLPEAKGDHFSITIDGKSLTNRKEAGELLKAISNDLFLQAKAIGNDIEREVGTYSGFSIGLRTTLQNTSNISYVFARGNFNYSADIKNDSDPVRICMSLHSKIYKDMDRMHESSKSNHESLIKNLHDYKEKSTTVFPKVEELTSQEVRYCEVMALLKKESENAPKQEQNPKDIPWYRLKEMTCEEVRDSIKVFYDTIAFKEPGDSSQVKSSEIRSAGDINAHIRSKYNFNLPPSVLSTIDDAIKSRQLDPDATYQLICSTIDNVNSIGYNWKHFQSDKVFAKYGRDHEAVNVGDVFIKREMAENIASGAYMAYIINFKKEPVYLGKEDYYENIKNRVENYVKCSAVRDKINETINLSRQQNIGVKEHQTVSYGIDI
ncbi:MAG: hypothetical protein JW915_10170 [Chitinispirillaceae bacterium]|nr:hypothetical protein [Chitinispirillaceae bacterium]